MCGKTRGSGARKHEPEARDGPEAKCSPEAIFPYKFPLRLMIRLAGFAFDQKDEYNVWCLIRVRVRRFPVLRKTIKRTGFDIVRQSLL